MASPGPTLPPQRPPWAAPPFRGGGASAGPRRCFALLALVFALVLSACTGASAAPAAAVDPIARFDPGELHVGPAHRKVAVALRNPGPLPLRATQWRIEGRDWLGFQITDASVPELIPARGQLTVGLRVDANAFAQPDPQLGTGGDAYRRYRDGEARLAVEIDGRTHALPIAFHAAPAESLVHVDRRRALALALCSLALCGLGLLGLLGLPGAFGLPPLPASAGIGGLSLVAHRRGPAATRSAAALGLAALGLLLAALPVAAPVCGWGGGLSGVGATSAAVEACSAGLGGAPSRLLPGRGNLIAALGALCLAFVALGSSARDPARALARAAPRLLAFAATIGASGVAAGTLELPAMPPPSAWIALDHPFAAVLALWALTSYRRGDDDGAIAGGDALDLGLAALYSAHFLGGGTLPGGLLAATDPATAAASALLFASCTTTVLWCARQLRSVLTPPLVPVWVPLVFTLATCAWLVLAAGGLPA